MECREVQDNLNNYIEAILPSEAIRPFEEHLASCTKCSESLADLRKSIELVKGLEEVEPPQWLTQKVMAKVREEAELKKGFFHRIFYPLHIKLPIEAAAVVFVAVISIYIFKSIEPQIQIAKAPSEMESPQSFYQEKGASKPQEKVLQPQTAVQSKDNISPSEDKTLAYKKTETTGITVEKNKIEPESIHRETVQEQTSPKNVEKKDSYLPYANSPMPAAGGYASGKLSEAQKAPAQAYDQDKVGSSAQSPAPRAKGEIRDDLRQEEKAAPLLKAKEEARAYNIVFTVNVKEIGPAKKEVWKALSQSGAKVGRSEAYKDRFIFSAEIDPSKIKELNEKLKNIGDVKQSDIDSSKTRGNLSVKIELVKM